MAAASLGATAGLSPSQEMRARLFELLRCPLCGGKLTTTAFVGDEEQMVEGVLRCGCGASFPVVNTIPRMLPDPWALFYDFAGRHADRLGSVVAPTAPRPAADFERLQARTQQSFSYQWTRFGKMVCEFTENFWNYLWPATPALFRGRLGLDAGCGFGRHIFHAAACGAEMVGMDFSRAIDSAYENTRRMPNVHLVQGDIYAPPFAEGVFDFVYSIGVLHHLPDPPRGLCYLTPLVRPGGRVFIWVYSKRRRVINFLLEGVRAVTSRLPHRLVNALAFAGALVDHYVFILPYRLCRQIPGLGRWVEQMTLPRIRVYSAYPFEVLHADWFDRLAAPIRFYYSEEEVRELMQQAGIDELLVTPTGLYGWRGSGVRR